MALDERINCFKLNHHCSDFLDHALFDPIKKQAEEHVKQCHECEQRFERYQFILSAIARQPKIQLPESIRKDPLSIALPKAETMRISISRWERIPWYVRMILEATGIVAAVLIGLTSTPKLRSLYENKLAKHFSETAESNNLKEKLDAMDSEAETITHDLPPLQSAEGAPLKLTEGDEVSGEGEEEEDEHKDVIKIGKSQLWRFTLKTVSPEELRPQVIKALTELKLPSNTAGLGGIRVPGGIEFDFVLPVALVPEIKAALQKLAPNSDKAIHIGESDNFTWYKVKSKRDLPAGKSQVVIWLAQPN